MQRRLRERSWLVNATVTQRRRGHSVVRFVGRERGALDAPRCDAYPSRQSKEGDVMTSSDDARGLLREALVCLALGAGLAALSGYWWLWVSHG
jgi:hypothetical protein